ncbi:MAG: DUF4340 domain-containing protein [Calditrichae bacterium]|nr:DUF4340 domain-containing protein [Calditrichia bacterium]
MKIFRTLGLLVILIALSAYVYFYEIKGGEEREKQKAMEEKVFHFETDSVDIIEIRSIFNRFWFERSGDNWTIKAPVKTGGDKSAINRLLTTMSNITKIREFTIKDGDQKDYGLVARSVLAIIQFKNGERDSLRFGDATPVENSNYAGRGDSLVYILSSSSKQALEKQLFDWRDKSVSKIDYKDVVEMRLRNAKGSFTFVKEGADWYLNEPRRVLAENLTVNTILRKIQNDKIKSIISEDFKNPNKFRLKKPGYVVDLYLGEGKAHKQLMFSSLKGNVSNGKDDSRPHVFTVDSTFIRELDKSFFDLRDKKIVSFFNRDRTDSIIVQQGDTIVTFAKDTANTWWLNSGANKVKGWKINSLLSNIFNLKAKEFLLEHTAATRKYGLNQPERIVRIFKEGKQDVEVHFASPESTQFVVFCPDSKIVAGVSESSYDNIEVKTEDYIEVETGT